MKAYHLIIILTVFVSSCSWIGSKPKAIEPVPKPKPVVEAVKMSKTQVTVLDDRVWRPGASVYIERFKAGQGAEVNDSFDRYTLMLIKGITEGLKTSSLKLKVVTAEKADKADYVVNGFIEHIVDKRGRMEKLLFKDVQYSADVKGLVVSTRNTKPIIAFRHHKNVEGSEATMDSMIQMLGQELGVLLARQKGR